MGFSAVYKVLQDVFPQVDSRLLRAYAIEHSKDVDVAVEAILVEIIPTLPEESQTVNAAIKGKSPLSLSEDGGKTGHLEAYVNTAEQLTKASRSSINGATEEFNVGSSAQANTFTVVEPEVLEPPVTSYDDDANNETDAVSDVEPIVLEKYGGSSSVNSDSALSIRERDAYENLDQGYAKYGVKNVASFGESIVSEVGVSGSAQQEDTPQSDRAAHATKDDDYIHLDVNTLIGPVCSQLAFSHQVDTSSSKTMSEKDAFAPESFNAEDESAMALSSQDCSTELLEQIIEEAKNNKKTLVLAMNSVVDLMKEVELKEKAAEEVKEEATQGCSDILSKVDELKQALLRAKETNEMHAGEVRAEKAILATELKELQLRLFTLSDERNRSLGILDEMRRALEVRLASALEVISAAEEEKLEKVKAAKEAMLFQENQMEKVVEESKKLKLEAEENSKFQEFLMDRGRAIDILQGEISVKCQDVLLLKEKFDKRIPLSRSLSFSQTSSVLASSSSSFRSSTITPPEPEQETLETLKTSAGISDSYGFLEKSLRSEAAESPKSPIETVYPFNSNFPSEEEKRVYDRKAIIDEDGWELFDNDNFYLAK